MAGSLEKPKTVRQGEQRSEVSPNVDAVANRGFPHFFFRPQFDADVDIPVSQHLHVTVAVIHSLFAMRPRLIGSRGCT
jgi:hypothetical protein